MQRKSTESIKYSRFDEEAMSFADKESIKASDKKIEPKNLGLEVMSSVKIFEDQAGKDDASSRLPEIQSMKDLDSG